MVECLLSLCNERLNQGWRQESAVDDTISTLMSLGVEDILYIFLNYESKQTEIMRSNTVYTLWSMESVSTCLKGQWPVVHVPGRRPRRLRPRILADSQVNIYVVSLKMRVLRQLKLQGTHCTNQNKRQNVGYIAWFWLFKPISHYTQDREQHYGAAPQSAHACVKRDIF